MNQIRTFNGETVQVDKYFDQGTFDRNEYIRPCQCSLNKQMYLQIDNSEVSRQKVQCRPRPGIHKEMLRSLRHLHLRSPSIWGTKCGLLMKSRKQMQQSHSKKCRTASPMFASSVSHILTASNV